MKKIRITVLALMFVLMTTALAGCGRNDNDSSTRAAQPSTQAATQAPANQGGETSGEQDSMTGESRGTTEDERGGSVTGTEESTGVIGGLMDDVESGADRLTDDLTGQKDESRNTDESTGR